MSYKNKEDIQGNDNFTNIRILYFDFTPKSDIMKLKHRL